MKTSIDQYCINVTDLEKSLQFWETALGLTITHRIETDDFTEIVLSGEDGNRIQLARHHGQKGRIEHGNGFWKLYLKTDDCKGRPRPPNRRCSAWSTASARSSCRSWSRSR